MDILDSKKRYLQELLKKVTGGAGADLQAKYAPPPPAPVEDPHAKLRAARAREDAGTPSAEDLELIASMLPAKRLEYERTAPAPAAPVAPKPLESPTEKKLRDAHENYEEEAETQSDVDLLDLEEVIRRGAR